MWNGLITPSSIDHLENKTGILSAVACNLDADVLAACLPLLQESRVEALEWSFDALYKVNDVPVWFYELIGFFGKENRLVGHGVFFSLFSGKWLPGQEEWLQHLRKICKDFHFDHITEHFGFMTGKNFHHGAPLSVPFTSTTLSIGRERLKRIYDACRCPVGLENLAFSYSPDEVKQHGLFLEQLLEPVNGFIILDLHNFYCQLHNFDMAADELLSLYPLHRVREIHISGGSWDETTILPGKRVRRDTHDDSVPEEVFQLLDYTISQCPHLKYVVLEQLGNGLHTEKSRQTFYLDFIRMQGIVHQKSSLQRKGPLYSFLPAVFPVIASIAEDETLYRQQLELSSILESCASYMEAQQLLQRSSLAHSAWQIETWEPYMLETAMKIAQKWKKEE